MPVAGAGEVWEGAGVYLVGWVSDGERCLLVGGGGLTPAPVLKRDASQPIFGNL